jgi:plastocyanin
MNKAAIITIVVIVVIVGGGLIYWYVTMSPAYTAPASGTSAYQTPTSTSMPMDMNGMTMTSTPSTTPAPTSTSTPAPAPSATSASVIISNFAFSPVTLTIHKGTKVTWTNNDTVTHTVTGDNGGPSSSPLGQGDTYSYTFNTVGSFPYHCSIHPYMKATVKVIN